MTCFSFFRGAGPSLMLETHLCNDLLFLLPRCRTQSHAGDSPLQRLDFPSSGVPDQVSRRRLTSVMTCFSFFQGAGPSLTPATHLCNNLLFPSSGVLDPVSCWRLTSATTCFSFFRGARPSLTPETHLCNDLFFLLPRCRTQSHAGDSPLQRLVFPSSGVPGKQATNPQYLPILRCLSSFSPAPKAT